MTPDTAAIKIKETNCKLIFDLGVALAEARKEFPSDAKGEELWCLWVTKRLSISKTSAKRYIRIAKVFGGMADKFPGNLTLKALNELLRDKYSDRVREAILDEGASSGEAMRTVDVAIMHSLDRAEGPADAGELRAYYRQVIDGYDPDEVASKSAINTFKAANAHASAMARTAQTYRENKQFAPPKVIEKVEDDMTHAIKTWVTELPPERRAQIQRVLDAQPPDITTTIDV